MSKEYYGSVDGKEVWQYTLTNSEGLTVKIISYGGTVTNLLARDKNGVLGDVVFGFDSLTEYQQKDNPYFGSLIGRYANRIAGANFAVEGKAYHLFANNKDNSLHGGKKGFDKVVWDTVNTSDTHLVLAYDSKDGEEGYPGNLHIQVSYEIGDQGELSIFYEATTDRTTPINLTNHSYFNLSGGMSPLHYDHLLVINADKITEVDADAIPTGELTETKGGAWDFTQEKTIGADIAKIEGGYDHNYVLNKKGGELSFAARVREPHSGRIMEVQTTEPGLQFYSGNFLDGTLKGKGGMLYAKHSGFCLEAQHFPDSPHHPNFPNTLLHPGEKYIQKTIYKFFAES